MKSLFVLVLLSLAAQPPADSERRVEELAVGRTFDEIEAIALDWGLAQRSSAERHLDGPSKLTLPSPSAPIEASIYSLPSGLVPAGEAVAFLRAVRDDSPERTLIAVVSRDLRNVLAEALPEVVTIRSLGVPYSPWPRDPLSVLHDQEGRRVVVVRPDVQRTREADVHLGRALVQGLPPELDAAWGELRWTEARVPFHNGQILVTEKRLWLSLHSVEPRCLELTGLDRVPVAGFAGPDGERYLAAARRAAAELGELYGHEAVFVHPLPGDVSGAARAAALMRLGGGAGFDLDSVLTLLPSADGGLVALVADLDAGRDLVVAATDVELAAFAGIWGLGSQVRRGLLASQEALRARSLDVFLEEVASHLGTMMSVRRLPLLAVRRELQANVQQEGPEFLVGWNNVVLDDVGRAEGFALGLASGDALARRAFERAGYALTLFPALRESVLRNGGYRCASQHVRRVDDGSRTLENNGAGTLENNGADLSPDPDAEGSNSPIRSLLPLAAAL